jgi:hypothetical protein
VQHPTFSRYLLTFLCLGLGLTAKPMLVTVPLVLLLLDYWPLRRLQSQTLNSRFDTPQKKILFLIREKIPFFMLSIASAAATLFAQHTGGALAVEVKPIFRIANAVLSYVAYIRKMLWPADLAVIYPYPAKLHIWQIAAAGAAIAGISILVLKAGKRQPYLVCGWLWYVVTLIPVIGLVQAGSQALADRYTYVPLVGLFVVMVWGASALLQKSRFPRFFATAAAAVLVPMLMTATWIQAGYWKDSATLFERTLMVTGNNFLAHNNLGVFLQSQGKTDAAVRHYS